jgi:hypothetical protein
MNTICLLLTLICTRQIFHYIHEKNEYMQDKLLVIQPTVSGIKNTTHIDLFEFKTYKINGNGENIIKKFLKFPPQPKFIKNINMDNSKFWFMLLTIFI